MNKMPHSTHDGDKKADRLVESSTLMLEYGSDMCSGRDKKADGNPAQANTRQGTRSSQTTMLDRWATQTSRSELPFTEVVQQPDAE